MTPRRSEDAEQPATKPSSITLASGREISKSSLFTVLQAGGWTALWMVCSFAATQEYSLWPALFDTMIFALVGCVITLGIRQLYRRSRRLHHSYVVFAVIALTASMLLAPLWYTIEHIAIRTALPLLLHVDSWRSSFTAFAVIEADRPLFFSIYLWPFYSIILF
ncbi:MAG TPA: hypothetical protein VKG66_06080, partial [Steroidobacteraceae bacterium]|nr:hypothetical protein [Steroidobacteraceae bacterium]